MNRRLLLLIGVAVLLGTYVVGGKLFKGPDLERATGLDQENQSASAALMTEPGPPAELNPLEGLRAESFSALLERPLFNPGRMPRPEVSLPPPVVEEPPPAVEPVAVGPNAQDFKLLAIAVGPAGRVAALRLAASGEVLYLREGNPVETWTVIAMTDRALVIGTSEINVTLNLFEEDQPVAPDEYLDAQPETSP